MPTANEAFDALLRRKIEERIDDHRARSLTGISTDLNVHNYNAGRVAGLLEVLSLCDETETEIKKR